jgi:LmbE family N-acetylglucosaminyl deacetylase
MKKKVLVIVAHPDDETIWMGGTLLANKDNWSTTIISLCRQKDKDRAPKFRKACEAFNAKCFMFDIDDEKLTPLDINEIISKIKLYAGHYDYIFTHGKNGEYGHIRHKEVHKAVTKILKTRLLKAKKIFYFFYIKKNRLVYPGENSDKFIKLSDISFMGKKKLIQNVYGFTKGSFEYLCCRGIEAFKIKRNT